MLHRDGAPIATLEAFDDDALRSTQIAAIFAQNGTEIDLDLADDILTRASLAKTGALHSIMDIIRCTSQCKAMRAADI